MDAGLGGLVLLSLTSWEAQCAVQGNWTPPWPYGDGGQGVCSVQPVRHHTSRRCVTLFCSPCTPPHLLGTCCR